MSESAAKKITTKEKIRLAAIDVFRRQGFDGARTRDIADTAGINIATLHYHYSSKDDLYDLVAGEAMQEFASIYKSIFVLELPLRDKVRRFVNEYTDLCIRHPDLPTFCLSESNRNPQRWSKYVDYRIANQVMEQQLKEMAAAGEIRSISTQVFINALVGLTIFPFMNMPSIKHVIGMSDAQIAAMLEEHRGVAIGMIEGWLFAV